MEKRDREYCIMLLRDMQMSINSSGDRRYPRRSDFCDSDVCAIKAHLGPWPRALEAAGLKPPRSDDRLQKNREKRIRAKRNRNLARKAKKSAAISEKYK